MSEPNLIDITNDNELMDRVLKKSAEMQEETLKKAERERTCIVCHRQFMQQMKINKQGKMVRVKGKSDKFCSERCREKFRQAYLHDLRAGNEHYMEYNRKRMAAKRYEQYKERAKPLYDELKSLILCKEDDAALELLTDISLGRLTLEEKE